jgi:hypothetical protein
MKKHIVFCFLTVLLLSGCQSTEGIEIQESDYSVKQHRVAVTKALTFINSVSDNGREITSHFHDRNLKYFEVNNKTKERLYTKVTVLGSRRPYSYTVEVRIEKRDPQTGRFTDVGLDEKLSLKQALTIKKALSQSRASQDLFDETTPF